MNDYKHHKLLTELKLSKPPVFVSEFAQTILDKGAVFTFIETIRNRGKTTFAKNFLDEHIFAKNKRLAIIRLTLAEVQGMATELYSIFGKKYNWKWVSNSLCFVDNDTFEPKVLFAYLNSRSSKKSTIEIRADFIWFEEYNDLNMSSTNLFVKFNQLYKTFSRMNHTRVLFTGNSDVRTNEFVNKMRIMPPVDKPVYTKEIYSKTGKLMVYYIKTGKEFYDNSLHDELPSTWLDEIDAQMAAYAHGHYLKGNIDIMLPIDEFIEAGNLEPQFIITLFGEEYVFGSWAYKDKQSSFIIHLPAYANFIDQAFNKLAYANYAMEVVSNLNQFSVYDENEVETIVRDVSEMIKERSLWIDTQDFLINWFLILSKWKNDDKTILRY